MNRISLSLMALILLIGCQSTTIDKSQMILTEYRNVERVRFSVQIPINWTIGNSEPEFGQLASFREGKKEIISIVLRPKGGSMTLRDWMKLDGGEGAQSLNILDEDAERIIFEITYADYAPMYGYGRFVGGDVFAISSKNKEALIQVSETLKFLNL